MSDKKFWLPFTVTVLGVIVGCLSLAQGVFGWKIVPTLISENSRFLCQQQYYPNEGSIWTVVYDDGKTRHPWMRMVNEFGGGWNQEKRCDTIAERLEGFRKDGLIALDYRTDPNTLSQYVICARTKLSGDKNCPLLVTLKSNEDPYPAFSKSFAALQTNSYVDRSSTSQIQGREQRVVSINVEHLLSK
jgi:hypothetical protein